MTVQFYMNKDVRLRRGILSFPPKKGVPEGRHVAYLDKTTPHYKFLLMVPGYIADEDLDLWALDVLGVTPKLGGLEAVIKGGNIRIKIPPTYLSKVSLGPNSWTHVIRHPTDPSSNFSEVWKRSDFRDYERSVSWEDIYKIAMSFGL